MVKNLPSNAGDVGSIPGQGTKIPHAAGQLSPHATTTELTHLNVTAHVPQTTESMRFGACATTTERKPICHNEREAHEPQQKILHAATKTQHSQKNK